MKRAVKLLIAGAAFVTVTAAARGGWLVITVDDVPEHLVAGTPVDLPFTLRRHGEILMNDQNPSVEMRSGKSSMTVRATRTKTPGQYSARITAPTPGEWSVTVDPDFGDQTTTLLPIAAVAANAPRPAPMTAAMRGKHLFVAKGCAGCHQHAAAGSKMGSGPDLTGKRFAVDYLKQFLADPSIKPPTNPNNRMPDLDLKPAEIVALAAFINEARVAVKQ